MGIQSLLLFLLKWKEEGQNLAAVMSHVAHSTASTQEIKFKQSLHFCYEKTDFRYQTLISIRDGGQTGKSLTAKKKK